LETGFAAAGLAAPGFAAADLADVADFAGAGGFAAAAAGVGVAASCWVALAWRTLAESLSFRFVMIRSPGD
jgi:hypothetical protein